MLGQKSIVSSLVRYAVVVVLFLFSAGVTTAQTPIAVNEKPEMRPTTNAPVSNAPGAFATSAKVVTSGSATSAATSEVDPLRSEAVLMNAKVDEAPKPLPTDAAQPPQPPVACKRNITANVVALPQPIMLNRLGASVPDGLVFALQSDTLGSGPNIRLKDDKRPRPIVLRANVGDCLKITLTNAIPKNAFETTKVANAATFTTEVSLHVEGMQWLTGPGDDGSFVGTNNSSLASAAPSPSPSPSPVPPQTQIYNLYAKEEGTFLLYSTGDSSTQGLQLQRGLFGALNVQPQDAEWYRSQVTHEDLMMATKKDGSGHPKMTSKGQPILDYNAVYPPGHPRAGMPILKMLDGTNLVHSDLTAIITGPNAGRFAGTTGPGKPEPPCNAEGNPALGPTNGKGDPLFCNNPASPDRKQPYREVTIVYHEVLDAVTAQAFPIFYDASMKGTLAAGKDAFAINYGTGGIAAEVYANRVGVGPMRSCVDCKFEEFFLSAWSVGDPAMLVDRPANFSLKQPPPPSPATPPLTPQPPAPPPCTTADFEGTTTKAPNPNCANSRQPTYNGQPYTLDGLIKAARAYYPDDPSNVYHSYINDHLKFRILHGGTGVSHVHHQHAHQWLQSPNSDQGSYLDSQMISPGASYTLEMTYNGSGNRNKVVGDSIFHCHFYPHFASGMWAMWRTHDVFENGSELKDGIPITGARALPDGEIQAGTPIPALVPMPTIPMAPMPSSVFIDKGNVVYGTPAAPDPGGKNVTENPGFPFFIPGVAGARAPHPPLDFAPDTVNGGLMDGGLPRHVVIGGEVSYERHTKFDWSKDLDKVSALSLPEDGTRVEKVAMQYFSRRCQPSFFPDGSAGSCPSSNSTAPQSTLNTPPTGFVLNGLPLGPQPGAPFADPAIDDNGDPINYNPVTKVQAKRTYKAAAIQLNAVLNKPALGWHYSQQRMLGLWEDVKPTLAGTRKPEPLFFRGNSGDIIEYWHTNLVPNYYLVDDFQVRTPTDILGQHIHLVKFDVTSSDGAGNGFNYEDGTFSPQEVQETINAINHSASNGFVNDPGKPLTAKKPPAEIFDCATNPGDPRCKACPDNWTPTFRPQCQSWLGAQTTIQRWYLDPLVDDSGVDRTMRTVFTHDHFGPSTHQQAGLYAGLLIEPMGSSWRNSETGAPMGRPTSQPPVRPDGGPTSWKADILAKDNNNKDVSYREFALEFQDFQLAYMSKKLANKAAPLYPNPSFPPNPDPSKGYINHAYAIGAPGTPTLISTGTVGTHSMNYLNEPVPYRIGTGQAAEAFNSSILQPGSLVGMEGDPITPQLRAYQGDNVQIRLLVGAHMFAHQFNLHGVTWPAEPAWKNSGYRSAQPMGLSEHFELLFQAPSSSAPGTSGTPRKCPDGKSDGNCADYLYSPSQDIYGISNGLWGLFRAYDSNKPAKQLVALPNNPIAPGNKVAYSTCPATLSPGAVKRTFNITAVTAQKALAVRSPIPGSSPVKGQIVFNDRGDAKQTLTAPLGVMYVRSEDLNSQGKLNDGVPIEPLILRANAGDCIEVNLTNALDPYSAVFKTNLSYGSPLAGLPGVIQVPPSRSVGLHPQLLSYDAVTSTGLNVGFNSKNQPSQLAKFGETKTYQWFAGRIERNASGDLDHTPVEFGSLNLFPADPLFHHFNSLFGAMVIEPANSTWTCGEAANPADCDPGGTTPTSRASANVKMPDGTTSFREFVLMTSDDIKISPSVDKNNKVLKANTSAVNYRTEPQSFRYANFGTRDFSCMQSNQLVGVMPDPLTSGEPKTPIFTADVGDNVRFRMTHPFGLGTSQVFTVHGHVWQRNPYANNGTQIGNNSLSQWLGSRDNHGSTDHFDLVIDKAGGENGRAGDYLYTVFLPSQANLGPWGIFRVGKPNTVLVPNSGCTTPVPPATAPFVAPPQVDRDSLIRQPVNVDVTPKATPRTRRP
jgi:manganese oxidase